MVGARWIGFLAAVRKLEEEWRLEPDESLPREERVVEEPWEAEEATEMERGDISRSARLAPRAAMGLNSGGGV